MAAELEVTQKCECCGEEHNVDGPYAVISCKFEFEDGYPQFYASMGYHKKDAFSFVARTRLIGHFAVVIKVEDYHALGDEPMLTFEMLLEKDLFTEDYIRTEEEE